MHEIKINNNYSYLITGHQPLKNKIWEVLRFRNRNYYHSRLYKQGIWDGYTDFFDKKSGKFLTGLLPEIEFILKHFKHKYKLTDEREDVNFLYNQIDNQFLNNWLPEDQDTVTLEDYQVDFINQVIKYKRGIIKAPTSAGKTMVLLGAMKALPPNTPTLFLVNRKTLVTQNFEEMQKWGFDKLGRFDGTRHDPNVITCATVQSLHHLEKLLPKFKALFVDEIHMMMTNTAIKVYKKLKGCRIRIGLSATPFKFGERDKVQKYSVKGFFGPILKTKSSETGVLTTNQLQGKGRLSGSICTFYPIDESQIPYDLYIDAVTNGIAENWYFHKIVQRLSTNLKGRTLILVERISHGDILNKIIPNSLWVQGKDNEETRKYVIKELKKSKENIVAIATQGIFNVGVNVFVHNLINAAGGKAEHDIIQRMGRGLRTAEDKEILNYYDFIFRINPYLEKHSNQRIKVLRAEKHELIIKEKIDF